MRGTLSELKSFNQEAEVDLITLFYQLWGNKKIIILSMLLTLLLGFFYTSRHVNQYEAEVLLQIKTDSLSNSYFSAIPKQFSIGGKSDLEATHIALIKSRFILAPVVNYLNLDIFAIPQQSFWKKLFKSPMKLQVNQFNVPHSARGKPFKLVFTQPTHFSLYDRANHLVLKGEAGKLAENKQKNIQLLISNKNVIPANTIFSLIKTADIKIVNSLRARLKIKDLGEHNQNTGVLALSLVDTNPQKAAEILNVLGKIIQSKDAKKIALEASKTLEFLERQLPLAKKDLEEAESKLSTYRAKSGKIDSKLQATYLLMNLSELDKQISKENIEKIGLLQNFTPEHPMIITLDTKLKELQIERGKVEAQLKNMPASDQIAISLLRDINVKKTIYTTLLKKIQELSVTKAGIISDVRILSLAQVPHDPIPFKRQLIYFVSLFFGFVLGSIIVFARYLIRPKVEDPNWIERNFDLPNLAIIPFNETQKKKMLTAKGQPLRHIPLLAYDLPQSLTIEALRSLRTTYQVRLNSAPNNVVSILGICPGVGKTFISANFAYLLAAIDKRVLVIDTDMRRGTLHKYWGIPASPGLAEVLSGAATLSEALRPSSHENLTILARGAYPKDPSELLTGEIFTNLINTLSKEFDVVVIDTPPVLLVTDAVLIGGHSGTNYLVIGAGAHQPGEIEASVKRLTNAGVNLQGTIFNFYEAPTSKTAYGNKYGYQYGYYYSQEEEASSS